MRILAKLMNFFWGFCKELKKKKNVWGGNGFTVRNSLKEQKDSFIYVSDEHLPVV